VHDDVTTKSDLEGMVSVSVLTIILVFVYN